MAYEPTAELRFSGTEYTPSGELVFGEQSGGPQPGDYVLTLATALPMLVPVMSASLVYDPNVARGIAVTTETPWWRARKIAIGPETSWVGSARSRVDTADAWQVAIPANRTMWLRWQDHASQRVNTSDAWREGVRAGRGHAAPWVYLRCAGAGWESPWREARPVGASSYLLFEFSRRSEVAATEQWGVAATIAHDLRAHSPVAERIAIDRIEPWHEAGPPAPGIQVSVEPPQPPEVELFEPTSELVFCFPWEAAADLIFNRRCRPWRQIPIRRVHIVSSYAELVRLPERTPIPASAVTVSIDWDSWVWSLSATIAGRAAADLVIDAGNHDPDQAIEIETTINGYTWTAVAEQINISRQFGSGSYSLQARGRAAYLADPYELPLTRDQPDPRNAQQLAAEALGFTDWTLDWTAADWLIPGGVWNHNGTVMQALNRLAEAAGAAVQAHRSADSIAVQPRYPAWPWEWDDPATPVALTVPEAVITRLSQRPQTYPGYDGVYVSGEDQGVLARVVRDGSPGTTAAQMLVDPLCTHETMARARGGVVLAKAGRTAEEVISMPISTEIPLLEVGQLIEIAAAEGDWRALVTGVSVGAAWQDGLQVRQTITLERWYG